MSALDPVEALYGYARITHRLGMGKIRGELNRLGFRYVEPGAWAELQCEVKAKPDNDAV